MVLCFTSLITLLTNLAYATIKSFALKFKDLGLLSAVNYGSKIKYKVIFTYLKFLIYIELLVTYQLLGKK